jgi:IS605 OrfB family transposase
MSIRDLGEREFAEPVNPGKGRDKPECCNELLKRLDRMKRQRVFQTAHLILQEALAERLTSSEEIERDHAIDQHGIYRPIEKAKPVEIIFVEDLSRYKTSTDRTRRENSRLMKWCHGQIITKLKQMAEPFGLVVATIPPAYTSQFSARDGCAGVRVEEVTKQFEKRYPYSHLIKQETKKGERTELARHIQSVVDEFARLPNDAPSKKKRTLFVAVDGGPLFLPINRNKPDQADINAAINVALRGVAHPLCLDIYPVICCEDKKDDAVQIAKREWRLAKADKRFDTPVLADLHHKQDDAADISSLESEADADEPDSYSNVCSIVPSGLNENSFKEKSFYQLPNGQNAVSRWDLFQHVHWRARNTIETINKQRVDAWKQGNHP